MYCHGPFFKLFSYYPCEKMNLMRVLAYILLHIITRIIILLFNIMQLNICENIRKPLPRELSIIIRFTTGFD